MYNNTNSIDPANQLIMFQANKRAYENQITSLTRIVKSHRILSASIYFTCSENNGGTFFSDTVLYSGASNIPPELVDFLKLHIQALQEAVQIIEKKIKELQLTAA